MKGFTKLTIQIAVLSISMIALSFLTETDVWLEYFNSKREAGYCGFGSHMGKREAHYHWNYRAIVYVMTGITFFIMSVTKIVMSHKEEDFK